MRILRPAETAKRLGVTNVTLWRWEKKGRFPKRIKIGPSASGHIEEEINAWTKEQAEQQRA